MQTRKVFTVDEIQKKLEHYCVYQDRCHQEVENKMREYRLIPEAREKILLHLMQHNFLNEERFAQSFARGKFRIKKWGKKRIIRELKNKDISEYNIKKGLKEIEESEYLETLNKLVFQKESSLSETNAFKKKQKIFEFVYRRGFESNLIHQAIAQLSL